MTRRARATAVALALTALAGLPAGAAARTDAADEPVFLVTTIEPGSPDSCEQRWGAFRKRLKELRFTTAPGRTEGFRSVRTVSLHERLRGCDDAASGTATAEVSIEESGDHLAAFLARQGKPVDVVAHGLAGVVLRAAIARHPDLRVEDAVTIGTPHAQVDGLAVRCATPTTMCNQMDAGLERGKAFAPVLARWSHPSGPGGTDWTTIGSDRDEVIGKLAHLGMDADHVTTYTGSREVQGGPLHARLLEDVASRRDAKVVYRHRGSADRSWNQAPHVADRTGDDLVYGGNGVAGDSQDLPAGCVGYSEKAGGATQRRAPVDDPKTTDDDPLSLGAPVLAVVSFASVEAVSPCFRKEGRKYVSTRPTRINGLDYVPVGGGTVTIDTSTRDVDLTNGRIELHCVCKNRPWPDVVTLAEGPIRIGYPNTNGTIAGEGSVFRLPLSFSGTGKAQTTLTTEPGKTALELNFELAVFPRDSAQTDSPECFNGADDDGDGLADTKDPDCVSSRWESGRATSGPVASAKMVTSNDGVLTLDKAKLGAEGDLELGRFKVRGGLSGTIDFGNGAYEVTGKATLPMFGSAGGPDVSLTIGGRDGFKLNKLIGEVGNLNVPLGSTGLFWQRLKLGAVFDPFELQGGLGVSVGRRFFLKGKRVAALDMDGDLSYTRNQTTIKGKAQLFGNELATAQLDWLYGSSVNLALGGQMEFGFGDAEADAAFKVGVKATTEATYSLTTGDLDVTGRGDGCWSVKSILFNVDQTCGVRFRIRGSRYGSNVATSACAGVDVPELGTLEVGGVLKWPQGMNGPRDDAWFVGACDVDAAHGPAAPRARSAQVADPSAPVEVRLPGGTRATVLAVRGVGAAPDVVVAGPDGSRTTTPKDQPAQTQQRAWVLRSDGDDTTYVVVGKPDPGRWSVTPQPGSAPLAGVQTADVLPEPSVRATVARDRRGGRVLRWDVAGPAGQAVVFSEVGGGVRRTIATATGSGRGARRFVPATGRGGTRRIVAQVRQRGATRRTMTVARFRAEAAALPGRPGKLTFRRRGGRTEVRWGKAARADRYEVTVLLRGGRRYRKTVSARAPRVVRVSAATLLGTSASVTAVRAFDGQPGPVRRQRARR